MSVLNRGMEIPSESCLFALPLKVRDYECDLQGIVNNANYLHYLEHARHEFLSEMGVSFAEFHLRGIDFVVSHAEMDYKAPLHSGDWFEVRLWLKKKGVRWYFFQEIWRTQEPRPAGEVSEPSAADGAVSQAAAVPEPGKGKTLCVRAKVVSVATGKGLPKDFPELEKIFAQAYPSRSLNF